MESDARWNLVHEQAGLVGCTAIWGRDGGGPTRWTLVDRTAPVSMSGGIVWTYQLDRAITATGELAAHGGAKPTVAQLAVLDGVAMMVDRGQRADGPAGQHTCRSGEYMPTPSQSTDRSHLAVRAQLMGIARGARPGRRFPMIHLLQSERKLQALVAATADGVAHFSNPGSLELFDEAAGLLAGLIPSIEVQR